MGRVFRLAGGQVGAYAAVVGRLRALVLVVAATGCSASAVGMEAPRFDGGPDVGEVVPDVDAAADGGAPAADAAGGDAGADAPPVVDAGVDASGWTCPDLENEPADLDNCVPVEESACAFAFACSAHDGGSQFWGPYDVPSRSGRCTQVQVYSPSAQQNYLVYGCDDPCARGAQYDDFCTTVGYPVAYACHNSQPDAGDAGPYMPVGHGDCVDAGTFGELVEFGGGRGPLVCCQQ